MILKQYNCCICKKNFNSEFPLSPSKCIVKLGENSHKICSDCWWNKFAIENLNHKCPGCPIEEAKSLFIQNNSTIIDLSTSDD